MSLFFKSKVNKNLNIANKNAKEEYLEFYKNLNSQGFLQKLTIDTSNLPNQPQNNSTDDDLLFTYDPKENTSNEINSPQTQNYLFNRIDNFFKHHKIFKQNLKFISSNEKENKYQLLIKYNFTYSHEINEETKFGNVAVGQYCGHDRTYFLDFCTNEINNIDNNLQAKAKLRFAIADRARKDPNEVLAEVNKTFEYARSQQISYSEFCSVCGGVGQIRCNQCSGTGTSSVTVYKNGDATYNKCYQCNGTGLIHCNSCGGTGNLTRIATIIGYAKLNRYGYNFFSDDKQDLIYQSLNRLDLRTYTSNFNLKFLNEQTQNGQDLLVFEELGKVTDINVDADGKVFNILGISNPPYPVVSGGILDNPLDDYLKNATKVPTLSKVRKARVIFRRLKTHEVFNRAYEMINSGRNKTEVINHLNRSLKGLASEEAIDKLYQIIYNSKYNLFPQYNPFWLIISIISISYYIGMEILEELENSLPNSIVWAVFITIMYFLFAMILGFVAYYMDRYVNWIFSLTLPVEYWEKHDKNQKAIVFLGNPIFLILIIATIYGALAGCQKVPKVHDFINDKVTTAYQIVKTETLSLIDSSNSMYQNLVNSQDESNSDPKAITTKSNDSPTPKAKEQLPKTNKNSGKKETNKKPGPKQKPGIKDNKPK